MSQICPLRRRQYSAHKPHHRLFSLHTVSLFAAGLLTVAQSVWAQPDWLSLSFEQQSRIQSLEGQFRAGLEGSDQAIEMRNTLLAEADLSELTLAVEVADMRTFLADSGTPLDTTTTNPLDFLQANVSIPLTEMLGGDNTGFVKLGRFTMDQGFRRWVSRNRYRNTINAFLGIHAGFQFGESGLEVFYTEPTNRRFDGDPLDNEPKADDEPGDKRFWGIFYETPLPSDNDRAEVYLYGLEENRDIRDPRFRFDILSTGVRLFRSPRPSRWSYEVEGLLQFGDAPALNLTSAQRDHKARFLHLEAGYSFEMPWQPRLSLIYDYASGDKDPLDNESNSFDSLYGVPRPEYGPTGIFRSFVRNNIDTPGLRLNLQPADNVDAFVKLQDYSLASAAQGWRTTRFRHPGDLGEDHVGTQLETRVRWHLYPNNFTLEGGYTWLSAGEYMDLVDKGDAHYFYLQTILRL